MQPSSGVWNIVITSYVQMNDQAKPVTNRSALRIVLKETVVDIF